ncbi:hypothetical protein KP509_26G071500 [Ceratopteris richardii]|uniref:Thioredoxin domain-containing protein n=1 Tax=Ceratopteris richardii TaxID=49495 RepID=A0A8T2RP71_CERRI|nr:hypothetical protein KP509_26G071500 [Ceratopteris richardii]
MAQCKAERRTFDVYAGIFNTKLYASTRCNNRENATSRNFYDASAGSNNINEDSLPSERSPSQRQWLGNGYNKPPVLSDYKNSNKRSTDVSVANVGCVKDRMDGSICSVVNEEHANSGSPSDLSKLNASESDVLREMGCSFNDCKDFHGAGSGPKSMPETVGYRSMRKDAVRINVGALDGRPDGSIAGDHGGSSASIAHKPNGQQNGGNQAKVHSGGLEIGPESCGVTQVNDKIVKDNNSGGQKFEGRQKKSQSVTTMALMASSDIRQTDGLVQGSGHDRKSKEFYVSAGRSLVGEASIRANGTPVQIDGRGSLSVVNDEQFGRKDVKVDKFKPSETSPSSDRLGQVFNPMLGLRVRGSSSTDSSSSNGEGSHSGSPTARDDSRDSKVFSFGNILPTRGGPNHFVSQSMGNGSKTGNGSLEPIKSRSSENPGAQFRYSNSSGGKSAELVPDRRYSEVVPGRKSSEMTSCYIRGSVTEGYAEDMLLTSVNLKVTGNMSSGSNRSVHNGNLLVGSGNGNIKSIGGTSKPHPKQGDAANLSNTIDCTLLKKAQASLDPEEIKNAGNEYYRGGHFSEALVLYTKAANLSPKNAAYKSNRAAALSALGKLGEAVKECEIAIRLDASYSRAHQRLAVLYSRLGLVERARQHFNAAGQHRDHLEMQKSHHIDQHLSRCFEARKQGDWQNVIRESDAAVVAGADFAPQIFSLKSEALLQLGQPDNADDVCRAGQKVESSLVNAGVLPADPSLLTIRAQVDMALGKFEGALDALKSAAKIDPYNEHILALLRKAETVCQTRVAGNELFRNGRFFEALAVYAEGLESDPKNAVLLCNRAACRSKLGQWEKAVEDCDVVLRIQPNYMKALMRRADCLMKLERWEDALQDYELLRSKMPEDLEVARGLFDVHVAVQKSKGEDTSRMKFGGDIEEVRSSEQFHNAIGSPGLSVVQFSTKGSERCRQIASFIENLCKHNPSANFLRVDVDDNALLAKSESVTFIPTFKIYKGGQKLKEIVGPTEQSLEYALRQYTL